MQVSAQPTSARYTRAYLEASRGVRERVSTDLCAERFTNPNGIGNVQRNLACEARQGRIRVLRMDEQIGKPNFLGSIPGFDCIPRIVTLKSMNHLGAFRTSIPIPE